MHAITSHVHITITCACNNYITATRAYVHVTGHLEGHCVTVWGQGTTSQSQPRASFVEINILVDFSCLLYFGTMYSCVACSSINSKIFHLILVNLVGDMPSLYLYPHVTISLPPPHPTTPFQATPLNLFPTSHHL